MIQKNVKYIFLVFLMVVLLFKIINTDADAADEILPINSVPDIDAVDSITQETLEFNVQGTIQRVGKDEVGKKIFVIDDRLMYIASDIKYYNMAGEPLSSAKFHKGTSVGVFFNDKRKITKLYLLSD